MKKQSDHKAYFEKAVKTCKDNKTTSTTWFHNFTTAYQKILFENKELKIIVDHMVKGKSLSVIAFTYKVKSEDIIKIIEKYI